jgi:hypothetical protein
MNKLSTERRAQILGMMVEGNSIRAIVRMTGASKNTIVKLLEDAGEAFSAYQDQAFRKLTCKRFQLDEIWAFCYAKQRNVPFAKKPPEKAGDIWTWVAIDAETKLIPSWRIGDRSGATAIEFVCDLSRRRPIACRLRATGTAPTLKRSRPALVPTSIMPNSSNSMAKFRILQAGIARHRSTEQRPSAAPEIRTRSTSQQATLSGRISRCACRCVGSRD